ncbi:hypothetical protein [Sphingobacterium siyangense]|uniref:hypothetical protein n=4 Tax=Sphingobacterium TaxID=28453 RepID=UPI002FDD48C1
MNISQKERILKGIEDILSFNFDKLISDNNKTDNVEDIFFRDYKASEFKALYDRTFNQLKIELEQGLGLFLPNVINTGSEYGTIDINNEITNFFAYLQVFPNKDAAAEVLNKIIYYEIFHGFWDKSSIKIHNLKGIDLVGAENRVQLLSKTLEDRISEFKNLKEENSGEYEELKKYLEDFNYEKDKIAELHQDFQQKANEIDFLLGKSNESMQVIEEVQKVSNNELKEIKKSTEKYKEEYQIKLEEFDNLNTKIVKLETENKKLNEEIIQSHNNIKSQEDTIIKLIGMAADGSLGYKFDDRNKQLSNNARNWIIGTVFSVLATIGWVYVVFVVFPSKLQVEWINLIINAVKTSPGWFLVAFCVNQYKKERNYQEQYAFKSAVAMTLTSYTNMLSDETPDKMSVKDSLLIQAVSGIYREPSLEKEEVNVPEKAMEKAKELLQSTADLIKSVK